MIDLGINPHEAAKEELEKAMAEGNRFAFEMEAVVLADLHRIKPGDTTNPIRKHCFRLIQVNLPVYKDLYSPVTTIPITVALYGNERGNKNDKDV